MKFSERSVVLVALLGLSFVPFACGKGSENETSAASGTPGSGATTNSGGAKAGGASSVGTGGGVSSGGSAVGAGGGSDGPGDGASVSVLTQHNDIARTGINSKETTLNPSNVKPATFGKLFAREVDDEIYTQPLLVSGLEIPGVGKRNVLYVGTVSDTVYAFDADDPQASAPLWTKRLLPDGARPPRNTDMTDAPCKPYVDFSHNIGIVGTPVIDPATQTLYVVARTFESGKFVQRLHALNIVDGSERENSPVVISATVDGDGRGSVDGKLSFDPLRQNQRAALLLLNGVVYITWAGHCDWQPYHGWIMGYDAQNLEQVVVYNTTPDGDDGGIWQSGQGPSSDGTAIYLSTGNGSIGVSGDRRSTKNRGHSFLKLSRQGKTLEVDTWFTPYNYDDLNRADLDLGSAGMAFIPGTHLAVSGGKGGWLYVVDRDDMGGLSNSASADNNVVQTFPVNSPFHIHGSPLYWSGPNGGRLFIWAEEDFLKAYSYVGESYEPGSEVFDTENVEQSNVQAPNDIPDKKEMPGGILSLSANGNTEDTAVLWASLQFSGDANNEVRPGVLRAFDASNIRQELWNSRDTSQDSCGDYAKFAPPTVANGKVYLASFSNQICVYGLR